jgi:hypothetical protein
MCTEGREAPYMELAATLGFEARLSTNPIQAFKDVVSDPGKALLVDMPSALHAGVSETGRLFDLGIDMPTLRCTQAEDGSWTAMCQAPFKRMSLPEALKEIAEGGGSWKHPKFVRRWVRVPLLTRARFRRSGDSEWMEGNVVNASAGGVFLLSMQVLGIGTRLDLELLDVETGTFMTGMVAWVHRWEDGPRLPGMGVKLERESVTPRFREALAEASTTR